MVGGLKRLPSLLQLQVVVGHDLNATRFRRGDVDVGPDGAGMDVAPLRCVVGGDLHGLGLPRLNLDAGLGLARLEVQDALLAIFDHDGVRRASVANKVVHQTKFMLDELDAGKLQILLHQFDVIVDILWFLASVPS